MARIANNSRRIAFSVVFIAVMAGTGAMMGGVAGVVDGGLVEAARTFGFLHEVDLINPHGTSTPLGDKREAEAIWKVFGDRAAADRTSLAISGTKSMTGHMMGAAGAFEAFATVMSVAEQCAPGTLNYRDFDPECDLWVPAETVPMEIRHALSNNIGLGGHNGAVIFKRYDGD